MNFLGGFKKCFGRGFVKSVKLFLDKQAFQCPRLKTAEFLELEPASVEADSIWYGPSSAKLDLAIHDAAKHKEVRILLDIVQQHLCFRNACLKIYSGTRRIKELTAPPKKLCNHVTTG